MGFVITRHRGYRDNIESYPYIGWPNIQHYDYILHLPQTSFACAGSQNARGDNGASPDSSSSSTCCESPCLSVLRIDRLINSLSMTFNSSWPLLMSFSAKYFFTVSHIGTLSLCVIFPHFLPPRIFLRKFYIWCQQGTTIRGFNHPTHIKFLPFLFVLHIRKP